MRRTITDLSTAAGILLALSFVALGAYLSGNLEAFYDLPSIFVVVFGSFALTMACFSFKEFFAAMGLVFKTIVYTSEDPAEAAGKALEIAEAARKKGFLALQNYEPKLQDSPYFRKGVQMIVDGAPPQEAEHILAQEIEAMQDRHARGVAVLKKAAEIAPAMGLIGTLFGLVQMLGQLDEPSKIGPSMALALLTTLYGAVMAYMILNPLAAKLERNSHAEALVMKIYLQTVSSIVRKENPRRLEMLVNAMLPPSKRVKYFG